MKRPTYRVITLAAMWALRATCVQAQSPAEINSASRDAQAGMDSDAIDALNKMGTYLRTLKVFQVHAANTTEQVLFDGQKITISGVVDLLAQRPNQLRVEVNNDRQNRLYLYDGKNFTLSAPLMNYYAVIPAPPTIAEFVNQLDEKYDIEMPLVDLFRWGGPSSKVKEIKAATDVGPSQVEGTTCEHYAFRQQGLDWQIWIQNGDYPLPRKLVLTTTDDDARPQHTSVYTWNLAPSFNEAAFTFVPSPQSQKIKLVEGAFGLGNK